LRISALHYKELPSAEYVRSRVDYDPETGDFRWKPRQEVDQYAKTWNARYSGKLAGYKKQRRDGSCDIVIAFDDEKYRAHRLAWLLMTNETPPEQLDHKNGDATDNRFVNLRDATNGQNGHNRSVRSDSHTGIKGVSYDPRRGTHYARIAGRLIGHYSSEEEAAEAHRLAALETHGEYVHPSVTKRTPMTEPPDKLIRRLPTSGVRGVIWDDISKKWSARVWHKKRNLYAGQYATVEEAKSARQELIAKLRSQDLAVYDLGLMPTESLEDHVHRHVALRCYKDFPNPSCLQTPLVFTEQPHAGHTLPAIGVQPEDVGEGMQR
jgi:hypothetical protein